MPIALNLAYIILQNLFIGDEITGVSLLKIFCKCCRGGSKKKLCNALKAATIFGRLKNFCKLFLYEYKKKFAAH